MRVPKTIFSKISFRKEIFHKKLIKVLLKYILNPFSKNKQVSELDMYFISEKPKPEP